MDTIAIKKLHTKTLIGVYPDERKALRPISIDLMIYNYQSKSGHTDNLEDTLDYAKISTFIDQFARQACYSLLEALAHHLIQALVAEFSLRSLKLRIYKPQCVPFVEEIYIEQCYPPICDILKENANVQSQSLKTSDH